MVLLYNVAASLLYSTCNNRPDGSNVVMERSYLVVVMLVSEDEYSNDDVVLRRRRAACCRIPRAKTELEYNDDTPDASTTIVALLVVLVETKIQRMTPTAMFIMMMDEIIPT